MEALKELYRQREFILRWYTSKDPGYSKHEKYEKIYKDAIEKIDKLIAEHRDMLLGLGVSDVEDNTSSFIKGQYTGNSEI